MRPFEHPNLKKQKVSLTKPLRIISDACIAAAPIGDGRNIPLVIIDASDREDIEDYILNHKKYFAGDVDSRWGYENRKHMILILDVKQPIDCQIVLEFDVNKQGLLIDLIMSAKALYIQTGKDGDRMINTPEKPKVLFEIPADEEIKRIWSDVYYQSLVKKLKKNGLSKKDAIKGAKDMLNQFKKIKDLRMRS